MISQLTEAARPAPELTHRLNEIVLTSDEAASLEALLQKARAVYDAAPEGAAYALRCHLDQLVRAVEDIASLRAHRRETSFDDEGGASMSFVKASLSGLGWFGVAGVMRRARRFS
ncbi:hypothetical protein ACIOEY_31205, partial [Streptomyces albidoflavus]